MGLIVVPLTAWGVMANGRRLSGCSWSCYRKAVPATQMSPPGSGRACTIAFPFRDDTWASILGAGSKEREGGSLAVAMNGVVEMTRAPGVGGVGGGSVVDVNEEEVVTIPGTLLRSGQSLAAVACDVGWTQLVATLMEARSTARTCLGP